MTRLAIWAKKNPWSARLIIGFLHISIAIFGLEAGLLLAARGIWLPPAIFFLPLAVFSAVYLAYPNLRPGTLDAFIHFRRRKWLDSLLIGAMACMWLFDGNLLPGKLGCAPVPVHHIQPPIPVVQGMLPGNEYRRHPENGLGKIKRSGKLAGKWLSHRIEKKLKRYAATDRGALAGVIVLGVLLTVCLAILMVWLSCSLACAGNGGMSFLVVILGGGLIAGLWVSLVRWIKRLRAQPRDG